MDNFLPVEAISGGEGDSKVPCSAVLDLVNAVEVFSKVAMYLSQQHHARVLDAPLHPLWYLGLSGFISPFNLNFNHSNSRLASSH